MSARALPREVTWYSAPANSTRRGRATATSCSTGQTICEDTRPDPNHDPGPRPVPPHGDSGIFLLRFRDFPPVNSRVDRIVLPCFIAHHSAGRPESHGPCEAGEFSVTAVRGRQVVARWHHWEEERWRLSRTTASRSW